MSLGGILVAILVIVVIIAIVGGAGTGFFYWFTQEPKTPEPCVGPDGKPLPTLKYRDANGKEACCDKKVSEWSRLHRQYTKCA